MKQQKKCRICEKKVVNNYCLSCLTIIVKNLMAKFITKEKNNGIRS